MQGQAVAEVALPCAPASAAAARRFVTAQFQAWDRLDLLDTAELLVNELVTNVLLHARTDLVVTLERDGRLIRVAVADSSARVPLRRQHSRYSGTGRGLLLVEQLATEWGVERLGRGKRVWLVLGPEPHEPEPPDLDAFADDEWGALDVVGGP